MLFLLLHEHNFSSAQIDLLSQLLKGKDKEIEVISTKNEELSNIVSKLSEVDNQLQEQQQNHCKQVSNHYQTCGTTDDKRGKIMFTSACSDGF